MPPYITREGEIRGLSWRCKESATHKDSLSTGLSPGGHQGGLFTGVCSLVGEVVLRPFRSVAGDKLMFNLRCHHHKKKSASD